MPRFRATSFGRAIAPWRATAELAQEDAIEAGEASRDGFKGTFYRSPGLVIETAEGDVPITPDQERWAEALQVLKTQGARAEAFIASRMDALADDPAGRARWRQVRSRLAQIREAAGRRAG